MTLFFLIVNIFLLGICQAEIPQTVCLNDRPFKTKENYCANFNEICVKKDDLECDNFISACKECPPTNYSVIMFRDIVIMKGQLLEQDIKMQMLFNLSSNMILKVDKGVGKSNTNSVLLIVLIVITFALLITIICIMKSTKRNPNKNFYIEEEPMLDNMSYSYPNHSRQPSEINNEVKSIPDVESSERIVSFEIKPLDKRINMTINESKNVIDIKIQICKRWMHSMPHFCKIMRLRYKGKILDDNQYLPPISGPQSDVVVCEIKDSIDEREILILHLQSDMDLPSIIQIEKSETVSKLRGIIKKFLHNQIKFEIFKENIILPNSNSLLKCGIKEGDWITIVEKKSGCLTMTSLFDDHNLNIEYSNIDRISKINKKGAEQCNIEPTNFVSLHDKCVFDEEVRLFRYDFTDGSPIKYFCLKRMNGIEMENNPIDETSTSKLFKAKHIERNENLLVLKYKLSVHKLKQNSFFLNQLTTLAKTQDNEGFAKLFGIFRDEKYFYEAIKEGECGSFPNYFENNKNVSEDDIAKWTLQIMEGLQYLHENNIYYDDLIPNDILIDEKRNIKLLPLGLYKYLVLNKYSPFTLKNIFTSNVKQLSSYLAPENKSKPSFNKKSDIWSLGAIIIYIANGGRHPDIKFDKNKETSYELPENRSKELKEFIKGCMDHDPDKRPTIKKLMGHKFVEKQIHILKK